MCFDRHHHVSRRIKTTRAQREIFLIEPTRPDAKCSVWFYKFIRGALDIEVLANAIKYLTSKVPLIQTRFIYSDGDLWQIHDRSIHHVLKTIDVSAHSTPMEEALRRMRKAVNQPGSMIDDELYEYMVYKIGNDSYMLYSRYHHSIIDGRSWGKLEYLLATIYNELKQGKEISVEPELHFDALACADAMYQDSNEHEEDKQFWQNYIQPLKHFAYTQRSINSVGKMTTYRQTTILSTIERQKLQQVAAEMNIPESFLYIGVSALLLRSLVGHEYFSLSLPVSGTYLTKELGMTSNVLPLLLHIPGHATIREVLLQIEKETKSILKHQRYRIQDILQLANYKSNFTFGPYINVMRYEHTDAFQDCSCSSHFGGNIDVSELQITFWTDRLEGRLEILIDDIMEGHSEEQLAALKDHLNYILDQIVRTTNSTVATLDEQCRTVQSVNLCESFYVNRCIPIAAGFLQWSRSSDFLVRQVQSNTWIGNGTSPFAISKVLLIDRVVSIEKLERIPNFVCSKVPGTVMKIDKNAWHVTTADGVVKISIFTDVFGKLISAQTLADQCHIREGTQFPVITHEQVERLRMTHYQAMQVEPYWSERLANFEPCTLSIVQNSAIQTPAWALTDFQSSPDINFVEILVAWVIYIARDNQMSQLQIGWDATECWQQDNDLSSIFAKTVPFHTFIDLNGTFSDVMARVQKDHMEMVNHLPCPSDILIRHAINQPDNFRGDKPWAFAVSLIDMKSDNQSSKNDACKLDLNSHSNLMTLQINNHDGTFRFIYDINQITEEEVYRISSHLLTLLASAGNENDNEVNQIVAKLNLLPKAERELLINTWNPKTVYYPPARCLHELFESQVECNRQAIAVEFRGKTLSYAKLNIEANRLAHYLISLGVKPDDRIALCVERSTTMIVAILGILKSGSAYVPLDPSYPNQWLMNILQDSDSIFLLADDTGRKALGHHQVPVVDLDKPLPDDLTIDNPDADKLGVTATNLAYVIYTSGSTGTPKGVMIEHQQIVRLFEVANEKLNFDKHDKRCLFYSYSFDVSIWEIFGALCFGSQLFILPYNITRSVNDFCDWMCKSGITVLSQTPSGLKMLLRANNINLQTHRLRYLILAGEALDPSIVRDWYEKNSNSETVLVNMYGHSETGIFTTSWIDDITTFAYSLVPIGRPLSNTQIYLLDAHAEVVPLGAEGEIYIGGAGVARGYLNRPELTAERFLPDPFSETPASRMYRTGDRARYLPDGNLVYLGRTDLQVKIRGFRIEPGEIEAHLVKHPQVQESVVQPHGTGSDVHLVAYIVTDSDESLAQDLRHYLSTLLPDYMVPAAYVCLSSLPLTLNGKLDRRALPAPDDESFARQQYEAPQGEMEEKLAKIWCELLCIERISRYEKNFALGGHSLLVVQLLAQLRKIGIHTNVREVLEAHTLATLASILAHYQEVTIPPNLIETDSTEITPGMLPLITLSQAEIDSVVTQIPGGVANIQDIYGLTPLQHDILAERGDPYLLVSRMSFIDRMALEGYADALQHVIERHDILRTVFIHEGLDEPAQVVLRHISSPLTEISLDDTDESVLEQLNRLFDPREYRLDLTKAPLLRLLAAQTSEGSWVALQLMGDRSYFPRS